MTDVPAPTSIKGVIFDFHGTLVSGGDPDEWIAAAVQHLVDSDRPAPVLTAIERKSLRDFLDRVWVHSHAIDPDSTRDLSHALHQEVFARTMALSSVATPELGTALYAVMADQWTAFDDTLAVIEALKAGASGSWCCRTSDWTSGPAWSGPGSTADRRRGAVLRGRRGQAGPGDFRQSLHLLNVPAEEALMVGDSTGTTSAAPLSASGP